MPFRPFNSTATEVGTDSKDGSNTLQFLTATGSCFLKIREFFLAPIYNVVIYYGNGTVMTLLPVCYQSEATRSLIKTARGGVSVRLNRTSITVGKPQYYTYTINWNQEVSLRRMKIAIGTRLEQGGELWYNHLRYKEGSGLGST